MIPFTWSVYNNKTHRSRENSSCQTLRSQSMSMKFQLCQMSKSYISTLQLQPIVSNKVICTSKFIESRLTLRVLTTKQTTHKTKGYIKTLRRVRYVYYPNCDNGVMGLCICPNSSNCTYQIYAVLYICYTILLFFLRMNQLSMKQKCFPEFTENRLRQAPEPMQKNCLVNCYHSQSQYVLCVLVVMG